MRWLGAVFLLPCGHSDAAVGTAETEGPLLLDLEPVQLSHANRQRFLREMGTQTLAANTSPLAVGRACALFLVVDRLAFHQMILLTY